MEIKTLQAFLAVAEDENMTKAAARLHVAQSTLSKQVKALEKDLGKKLFVRESFGLHLTEEGRLLRERARDLVAMVDKIQQEFLELDQVSGGTIYFGLAESHQIRYLARELRTLKDACPDLHYRVISGVSEQVLERLDQGILDFGVLMEPPDPNRYESLEFPQADIWGLVTRQDSTLAKLTAIHFDDLVDHPLFCSEQGWRVDIPRWVGAKHMAKLQLEGTFGLSYNGAIFVREGLGHLLTLEKIIDVSPGSGLAFRPLDPPLVTRAYLVWKRGAALSPIARRFLEQIKSSFAEGGAGTDASTEASASI